MQKKIFFNFVIILLVGVLISGFLSVRIIQSYYNSTIVQKMESNSYLIKDLIGHKLINGEKEQLDKYLLEIKDAVLARITIIDINGIVLNDTDRDSSTMENHSDRPEIKQALAGRTGNSKRYSNTLKTHLLYIAQPLYSNGSIQGVLRLSTPLYEINSIVGKLYRSTIISIITGLLVASFLGFRVAVRITKPIKEITQIASLITKGQFEKRINLIEEDEIGQLASSINFMASTLNDTINSIKDKNIKMEATLSSVMNGIIAIDSKNKILFINPVAFSLLNIKDKDIIGKHFLQVVRNNQLDDFLKTIIKESNFQDIEICLDYPEEKILKIYTNPIRHIDKEDVMGIIIVVQDITELRKLERMRSEFVANVSHELKTPLTSIKGFVETLKGGAIEDQEAAIKFLNIIEDEADRLNRLISDILSLSELENKKNRNNFETIDINNTILEVVSMLTNQAMKKNIIVSSDLTKHIMQIYGDKDKFKQMIINLLDNAIKYTPDNGKVKVQAYDNANSIIINIIDNGIGISKEHIPRLFERFYRVDRARSRRVGGTGLGLAIVKYIIKLFNGEINVESTVGKGTKFQIILPHNIYNDNK